MDDDDLNRNLINQGKKGAQNYQKRISEILNQIQLLKNKNNLLQKQSDQDLEDQNIKDQIYQQTHFFEIEINKIKKMLTDFSKQFKDPSAKNKLKQMWKAASKQIQRNKIITQRIVNEAPRESFLSKNQKNRNSLNDQKNKKNPYLQDHRRSRGSNQIVNEGTTKNRFSNRISIEEQDLDDSDLVFQQKIIKEKNEILNHLEHKNLKINKVMNQIALLVDEQGEQVNLITNNMNQAGQNLLQANENLDEAIISQKKVRRKYCCLAAVLLIVCLTIIGVIFILTSEKQEQKKS